jgi:uncharacterized protein (TIGR00645 family)
VGVARAPCLPQNRAHNNAATGGEPMSTGKKLELAFERVLFSSRWLLAPFYLGMVFALLAVLVVFVHELVYELAHVTAADAEQVIILSLSLIDLSLTGNLLVIVIFAGYENFVSRMHVGEHEDRPGWMGTIDFSDMKVKLIASIVAISGIALLRAFLTLGDVNIKVEPARLAWMLGIHLTFVVSGVLLVTMDWIASKHAKPDRSSH